MDQHSIVATMAAMKFVLGILFGVGIAFGSPLEEFVAEATMKHGDSGKRAAGFLVENMPEADRKNLSKEFLMTHLDLAFQARNEFPWAKQVPEEIFLNDVLPYAVFDETREAWRADFLEKARPIVKDAKTSSEAAQALNRDFFKLIKVHYNTGRKAPNQSPKESIESGRATCTGLAILLVDACRAVGIPARAVGTPMWSNGRGNHTWVEIWDGSWHFTGADEYDAQGLNRGWFTGDAAQAKQDMPLHAIYATSWKKSDTHFPMVWARESTDVAAVNVTSRYVKAPTNPEMARVGVRLFDQRGGTRIVAKLRFIDDKGNVSSDLETKAGTSDLNDMPRFELAPGTKGHLFFNSDNTTRFKAISPLAKGENTIDAVWTELSSCSAEISAVIAWLDQADAKSDARELKSALSKSDAQLALALLGARHFKNLAPDRKEEMENKVITLGDKKLRWLEKTFGDAPADGRSLWISMHGGGGAPAAVNDGQWQNQIRLYEPAEGIYIAPRAPTDTWNLWHEGHIDPMFQRLIEDHVILRGVNPNKIYLMGYSAGGDGVWQLAPRMADRFAAAAMMAGHPNEASLLGLRNLPFAIFMGGNDAAYDRNKIAAAKTTELDALEKSDPGAYVHMSRIYEGLGHWMNRKDAEALPWMAKFQRNPWPKKIVWLQDDVTHDRFYWLKIPDKAAAKAGQKIIASIDGQMIQLEGDVPAGIELLLSDQLLDLDQKIKVIVNGRKLPPTKAPRTADAILQSLKHRADHPAAATARLVLP